MYYVKKNILTDHFSCYKFNKTSTPSTKRKILPNLKIVIRVLGYSNTGVH